MLRVGWSQDHPDLKKKKKKKKKYIYIYIYNKNNNNKQLFEYPLKKKYWEHPQFFYANKIKFYSIICSTFKQKEKAQTKI